MEICYSSDALFLMDAEPNTLGSKMLEHNILPLYVVFHMKMSKYMYFYKWNKVLPHLKFDIEFKSPGNV